MKNLLLGMFLGGVLVATASDAFATNPFRVAWKRYYVDSGASGSEVKFGAEVKCNLCHLERERKEMLNAYGAALLENGLSIANFPRSRFETEPEVVQREIEEVFKKTERQIR